MNFRKSNIQIYAAFSLALLMALVGWRTLGISAAGGDPIAPEPNDVETIEKWQDKNGPEPTVEDPEVIEPQGSDPEPTPYLSDPDAIRAAVAEHFEMDASEFYRFEIKEKTGTHARGVIDNSYFLAAKAEGEWVFVAGGQSVPNCNDVLDFGFPASMVPECPAAGSDMPDCPGIGTTLASFIKDVTIADGTTLEPGQYFTKTWRIQNAGTCTWNADYALVFASGDLMGGFLSQPLTLGHVPPGGTIDISLQLRAPDESGSYRGYWRFQDSRGGDFGLTSGGSVWVDIQVAGEPSGDEGSPGVITGYPLIEIVSVSRDQKVTIKGLNFPPQDRFDVLMNIYGTLGVNGQVVASILSGAGGEFTGTYQIPAFLQGQATIAIRLESPSSGYYAYNWFYNN